VSIIADKAVAQQIPELLERQSREMVEVYYVAHQAHAHTAANVEKVDKTAETDAAAPGPSVPGLPQDPLAWPKARKSIKMVWSPDIMSNNKSGSQWTGIPL